MPIARNWCIPMYTNEEGDEQSLRLFGKSGLGGPGGPKTPEQLAEYPKMALDALQILIEDFGFSSVEQFAREAIMDLEESGPTHFGRGLTHELSKFITATKFEEQLEIGPEGGSVVWDATGNADRYAYRIELALKHGYEIEIVYVTCPLSVALKRAAQRKRRVPPSEVRRTHVKAARIADDLEIMAGTHLYSNRMNFDVPGPPPRGKRRRRLRRGMAKVYLIFPAPHGRPSGVGRQFGA